MKTLIRQAVFVAFSSCLLAGQYASAFPTLVLIVPAFDTLGGAAPPHLPVKNDGGARRFYLVPYASTNIVSSATTNPSGLRDDESRKWNFGLRTGYRFWQKRRFIFSIETGATYRDFGFLQNESTIPYLAIPATLRLSIGGGFFKANFYGSAEFNRLLASRYHYMQPGNPSNVKHHFFLHQNDALTGLVGVGLSFGKGNFRLEVFTEKITQLDNYDLQFGQTIGAKTLGAALHVALL